MRLLLLATAIFVGSFCKAQSFFPAYYTGSSFINRPALLYPALDSNSFTVRKKWSLQTYKSIAAGMMLWKGGSASYVSAPIGLQFTRMVGNNVFAFAGVSIAPTVSNLRQSFMNTKTGGLSGFNSPYQFGAYSRAEMGIGYTNDARTFTITGSVSVQRSDFPFSPGYRTTGNNLQPASRF